MSFVLSLDTAFSACTVAVLDVVSGQVTARTIATERGQAEKLVPLIDNVLQDAGIVYNQLNLIVVTVGPGSFTGVRVGIATARGLGLALNLPVQGVLTTDALYQTWLDHGGAGPATVLINTKRDDLFVAVYKTPSDLPVDPASITITEPVAMTGVLIGDGVDLIGGAQTTTRLPDGGSLARLGLRLHDNAVTRKAAEPVYLRDAEVSVAKRVGRIPLDPLAVQ
jgi:tRNA threonylcarbamoyladenosine biosynthesis protein TsaB